MGRSQHCFSTYSSSSRRASSSLASNRETLPTVSEKWPMVERTANAILSTIRPNLFSEERRLTVIKVIQTMFRKNFGAKVFPLGSFPLKTFLPDGDIDLTAITTQNVEDNIATGIYNLLKAYELEKEKRWFIVRDVNMINAQGGEQALNFEYVNETFDLVLPRRLIWINQEAVNGAFQIALTYNVETIIMFEFVELQNEPKDTNVASSEQLLVFQVKIVKCMVNDISVDISFNKVGGLSTVCFLEKVDLHIGKDHLFKRSIILIKSWCYYESRILGASNGLVSTYALEVLILHVINMFPKCLCGPVAVLCKFLEYYSAFQWDKYGISVNGLITLEVLPKVLVLKPVSEADMIINEDFILRCTRYFSIPIKAVEAKWDRFQLMPMNIADPLNFENNLGRSISRGNFDRIKLAFSGGYRKLTEIVTLEQKNIHVALRKFFANTLYWQRRRKIENRRLISRHSRFTISDLSKVSDLAGSCARSFKGLIYGQLLLHYTLPFPIPGWGTEEDSTSLEDDDDDSGETSSCFSLSLEDFPLLSSGKEFPPLNRHAIKPTATAHRASTSGSITK